MNPALQYLMNMEPIPFYRGCLLYLPLWRYGANAQKAWDLSGQGNHGTISGAAPAQRPMLSGIELASNGSFTGNATGWTVGAAWAYNANAVDKNADGITTLSQAVPIVSGKAYRLSYWVSNWTVGTVTPSLGGFTGTARGANGYHEEFFVASSTANLVFTPTNTGRFTIDTVSVQEVQGFSGLGWSFDGTNDFIGFTDFNEVGNSNGELTVLLWHYFQDKTSRFLISHYDAGLNQRAWGIRSAVSDYTKMDVIVSVDGTLNAGSYKLYTSSVNACIYDWTMVGFTFNNGTLKLFVNGVEDAAPVIGRDDPIATIVNATADLTVGCILVNGAGLGFYKGIIGEAAIFNRVLSPAEIKNYHSLTRKTYGA